MGKDSYPCENCLFWEVWLVVACFLLRGMNVGRGFGHASPSYFGVEEAIVNGVHLLAGMMPSSWECGRVNAQRNQGSALTA